MEDKDFRNRLANRPAQMNPAAWEHMEILLNAQVPNQKKKRSGYFFLFFAITMLFFISLTLFINKDPKTSSIQNKTDGLRTLQIDPYNHPLKSSTINKTNEDENRGNTKQNVYATSNLKIRNNEHRVRIENKQPALRNYPAKLKIAHPSKDTLISDLINEKRMVKGSQPFAQNGHENEAKSITASTETILSKSNPFKSNLPTLTNKEDIVLEQDNKTASLKETNPASSKGAVDTLMQGVTITHNDWSILKLNQLTIAGPINSIKNINANSFKLPDFTHPIRSHGLYSYINGGLAYFNQNPGYSVGVGISKENHPLFGIGAEFRYTHASEPNVLADLPKTTESQSDLNIYIQLKLVQTSRFKAAVELGSGYTIYKGQRVKRETEITIYKRTSNGINFNGGLDLIYKLNKTNLIGLKIGTIFYDDQIHYINFKYAKSIH